MPASQQLKAAKLAFERHVCTVTASGIFHLVLDSLLNTAFGQMCWTVIIYQMLIPLDDFSDTEPIHIHVCDFGVLLDEVLVRKVMQS